MQKNILAIIGMVALAGCAAPTSVPPTLASTATTSPTGPAVVASTGSTPVAPTGTASVAPTGPVIFSPTVTPPRASIGSRTADIKEIENIVQARGSTEKNFEPANVGLLLNVGGQARTGENSKTRLDFIEGTIVRLGSNTVLTVEELASSDGSPLTRFQLELGKLWIALKGGVMDIKTPAGLVSVRGSYAILEVFADGRTRFVLLEGLGAYPTANTTLRNMQGLVIGQNGQADRFDVPQTFLQDFCDNNLESCQPLLALLGIRSLEALHENNDKNPPGPGKESPKLPPCRPSTRGGC